VSDDETKEAEADANICLTAFDILWAYTPREVLEEIDAELGDDEREVIQRAVDKSVVRRISDLPSDG
jgi:hypothetical protein